MAIEILSDVVMPESIVEMNVQGKQQRKNQRVSNQAGFVKANVLWDTTLRQFDLGFTPMSPADWQTIEGLFEITDGGASGFLMRDPKDSGVAVGEGLLQPYLAGATVGAEGLGYGIPVYRLTKLYSVIGTTRTRLRRITRPFGVAVQRAGGAVVVGGSAGQIALDANTGTVTFNPDASEGMTSVTVGASTVLNFATGAGIVAAMSVGERLYVDGTTGSAAPTLNAKSHAITAKGATSLTLGIATTGLTSAAGTAYRYPQQSQTLTWTGNFYVPVQFSSDEIDWEALAGGEEGERLVAGRSIVLAEVREP